MRVAVVGTGYVGLVSGACLADLGHDVTCIDIDPARVDTVNAGNAPIHEPGLNEVLDRTVGQQLRATTELAPTVQQSDVCLIAVGTPYGDDGIDLQYIRAAATEIGQALAGSDRPHVVIVKSTVVPGTTDSVVRPLVEEASGRGVADGVSVGMNPEFLREGSAVADFMHPDRIVIGADDERATAAMRELYAPFGDDVDVVETSTRAAEMIKYASNSLLATLISFSNEIANLSAEVGVDALDVMAGVHLDRRLTPMVGGERVWPGFTTYLEGGCGFGGSCFPKDVRALISFGNQRDQPMSLLDAVMQINDAQPDKMMTLLERHIDPLRDRSVTVLGMAFKPDTDDIRESPAISVTDRLVDAGARVTVFDPVAEEPVRERYGDAVQYADGLREAVDAAEAVLIMTRWQHFTDLPAILGDLGISPVVIDGRRLLEPNAVDVYEGIGL